ncbi:MAG: hypothetical protein DRP08_03945 [Candidatus Aenigmatarchaeota archaeon]|nr:MAG: hypothetical protein DRP08_03945 [Candidatus Aenigmarchaeota archaeon]
MRIEINGQIYDVPSWTKAVVEDMQNNYVCLNFIPNSMYEPPLCPLFPSRRVYKRIVKVIKEDEGQR